MKRIVFFIALLLIPAMAQGQVIFQQGSVTTTAQAQAFEYKLYQTVPTLPIATVSTFFITVTCTGNAPTVNCSGPTPPTLNKATGVKFEITARDTVNNTVESVKSSPFTFPAVAPTNLSITP